jgi:hypothetical protein
VRRPIGFLIWNPARGLPTTQHETFKKAEAEAERLRAANPDQTFWIMAPVKGEKTTAAARAFSDGKAEGLAQARAEIMLAEGRTDRLCDEKAALQRTISALQVFADARDDFQAIVADCLLWFDGFNAAQAGRESWERPHVPDREKLTALNAALQRLMRAKAAHDIDDSEIPF